MSYKEHTSHFHKSSIDEHIIDHPNKHLIEQSKFSLEEVKRTESQSMEENFLSDLIRKLDCLSLELVKINHINEELIIENELWKDQYQKMKQISESKDSGSDVKMHDIYQKNFITTLGSMENELKLKETKLANLIKNIKFYEKENADLKRHFEGKMGVSGSPSMKKDLLKKYEDLEKMNYHLTNELDQVNYEKKKGLHIAQKI